MGVQPDRSVWCAVVSLLIAAPRWLLASFFSVLTHILGLRLQTVPVEGGATLPEKSDDSFVSENVDHSHSECESDESSETKAARAESAATQVDLNEPIVIRKRIFRARRRRHAHDQSPSRHSHPITIDLCITYDDPSFYEPVSAPADLDCQLVSRPSLRSFQLLELIGEGSYAHVFRARVLRSGESVALKLVRAKRIRTAADLAYLKNEMQVLQLASGCALLCELLAAFSTPRFVCFVLPLAECDLLGVLEEHGALREDVVRFYAAQLLLALEFLHRKAVLYRDLKPDNVLVAASGYVKLGDFGMCKLFSDVYRTRTFCGSLSYMAPEILQGEPYSFPCDFWALGVLLFELLTARSPFGLVNDTPTSASASVSIRSDDRDFIDRIKGDNAQLVSAILHKPLHIPRSITVRAGSFLKALLNKDPQLRLGAVPSELLGPANLQPALDLCYQSLKSHLFFRAFDWHAVQQRSFPPPLTVCLRSKNSQQQSTADNNSNELANNNSASLAFDLRHSNTDIDTDNSDSLAISAPFDFSYFDFVSSNFST